MNKRRMRMMNRIYPVIRTVSIVILSALLSGCVPAAKAKSTTRADTMKKYRTIGEMIASGTARDNVWYWVDRRNFDVDADYYAPEEPLLEGGKVFVIPTASYFSTYWVVSDGCYAYRLEKLQGPDGEKLVLSREVSILHWGKQVTPEKDVVDAMNIDALKNGVHYFRINDPGGVVRLRPEDVPFLREYYRVRISRMPNTTPIITYEKIRPLVAGYKIYEYYPDEHMRRRVHITECGLLRRLRDGEVSRPDPNADDRDKQIEYNVFVLEFDDKGVHESRWTLRDRSSQMYLQNMLHD